MKQLKTKKRFTGKDWLDLFPQEIQQSIILAEVRPRIEEKITKQAQSQLIGQLRKRKVAAALGNLKKKGEIRDYFQSGEMSYANLIEGVDFTFIYIEDVYRVCYFSVTGLKWAKKHLIKHPQIPVLVIGLNEKRRSIEKKILSLKGGYCQKI